MNGYMLAFWCASALALPLMQGCVNAESAVEPSSAAGGSKSAAECIVDSIREAGSKLEEIRLRWRLAEVRMQAANEEERIAIFEELERYHEAELLPSLAEGELRTLLEDYESNHMQQAPTDSVLALERPYNEQGIKLCVDVLGYKDLEIYPQFYEGLLALLPDYYRECWALKYRESQLAKYRISNWADVGQWLLDCEAYTEKYPERTRELAALSYRYRWIQEFFLLGAIGNEIVSDSESRNDSIWDSWVNFVRDYPHSPSTPIVQYRIGDDFPYYEEAGGEGALRKAQDSSSFVLHLMRKKE